MRSMKVNFASGRELLNSYWGFLKHGGLVLGDRQDLVEGDPVLLDVRIDSLKKNYRLEAKVVRRAPEEGRAFVAFDEGQQQDEMLNAAWADSHEVPQRKHRRYPISTDVRYFIRDEAKLPPRAVVKDKERSITPSHGRLLNVSPGGCCLKGPDTFPVGTRLKVVAQGIELDGQVRWTTMAREMGIEFSKPDLVVQALLDKGR